MEPRREEKLKHELFLSKYAYKQRMNTLDQSKLMYYGPILCSPLSDSKKLFDKGYRFTIVF